MSAPKAATADLAPAGGCEGECELLIGVHHAEPDYVAHHNEVIRVLSDVELGGLVWLLGEIESAGENIGPALYPHQLLALTGEHNLPCPALVHRMCQSLARAYRTPAGLR